MIVVSDKFRDSSIRSLTNNSKEKSTIQSEKIHDKTVQFLANVNRCFTFNRPLRRRSYVE